MKAVVNAHELRQALAALRPKTKRFKSVSESSVGVVTAPGGLVFTGTLASMSTASAEILEPGSTRLPLESVYRLLSTYAKGARAVLESKAGRVYIDRMSFPLPSAPEDES